MKLKKILNCKKRELNMWFTICVALTPAEVTCPTTIHYFVILFQIFNSENVLSGVVIHEECGRDGHGGGAAGE